MDLIDRERLLANVDKLKQSPWFNRYKNGNFLHGAYLERKEAVEIVEDLCIKSEQKIEAIPKANVHKAIQEIMKYEHEGFINISIARLDEILKSCEVLERIRND